MVFTTLTFFIFLIVVFALYWLNNNRTVQNCILLTSSYFFYGWWDYRYLALMFCSSMIDFFAGLGLMRTEAPKLRRLILTVTLVSQLSILAYFKYFNFFIDSFVELGQTLGLHFSHSTAQIILPLGISFYTFQSMSYSIDVYRGHLRPTKSIIDYLAFVCFFPQLVAGPIERAAHLLPQFIKPRRFDRVFASQGCQQALWGFFKKVAIADNLGSFVDKVYSDVGHASGPLLALATICFAFQIYCDFSGYSDIGVGTAKLFGFDLMQNFNYPYFSQSISEFWRRWHISLSTWFRDYIYIPLGGNKVAPWRKGVNVMIVFMVSGLWHGASWNYVIWGMINGVFSLFSIFPIPTKNFKGDTLPSNLRAKPEAVAKALKLGDVPGGHNVLPSFPILMRMAGTFLVICVAWVFFRAATLPDALLVLEKIVSDALRPSAYSSIIGVVKGMAIGTPVAMLILLPGLIITEWFRRQQTFPLKNLPCGRAARWGIYTLLLWISIAFSSTASPFIYFQF